MNFSSAGFLRLFPAWIALLAVGCNQLPSRLWKSTVSRGYSTQTRFQVARLQESQGDLLNLQKAEQVYRTLSKNDPKNAAALHRLAIVTARQNRLDESIEYFRRAIKVNPTHANLMADYGHALFLKGDVKNAESALKTAVNQDPGNRKAVNNLAFAIGMQGRASECLATYRRIHSEAEARNNLAYVHSQRGEGQQAYREYSHALALNPKLNSAKQALAQLAEMGLRHQKNVRERQSLVKADAAPPEFKTLNASPERKTTSKQSHLTPTSQNKSDWSRVATHVFAPRRPILRNAKTPRKPNTGDSTPNVAEKGAPQLAVKRAIAQTVDTNAEPLLRTGDDRGAKKFSRPVSNARPAGKRDHQTFRIREDVRRIPNNASRHFPRNVVRQTTTQKSQADSVNRVGKRAPSRWAPHGSRSANRFQNRGIQAASTPQPESQPGAKPFPIVTNTNVRRKSIPASAKSSATDRLAAQDNSKRLAATLQSGTERPASRSARKIKHVGFQSSSPGLNLGKSWNANPPLRIQPRRRVVTHPDHRAYKPAVYAKSGKSAGASSKTAKTGMSKPTKFANFVDWNRAKNHASLRKPSENPFAQHASRNLKAAAPKASGWAPNRRSAPSRVATKRKPRKTVTSVNRARPSVTTRSAAQPERTRTNTGRVKLTPAPEAQRHPMQFHLQSSPGGASAMGRVKLTPNRQIQPSASRSGNVGQVRVGAR